MGLFTKDKNFYRRFFALTFTIALQNVIVFAVNLADNVMLGAYSESSLSGVALVNQIQFFLQMVVMGVGEGIIVLSSRCWGRKDMEPIRKIVNIGLKFGVVFAVILWAVVFFLPHQTLGLLTNEREVIAEGVKYLQIICFSYMFFAMTNVLLCALRSVETVKIGFAVSTSTLIINCCLNYCLIYGNLGAPELGARGAAIATLTSRVIEFIIVLCYLKFGDKKICLRLRDFGKMDKELLRQYVRVGSPVIASNAMWGIAQAIQTGILGHLGASAIAANSIATTVFQILSVVSYGAASASGVLVGKTIGEGKIHLVKEYAKTLQILYLIIGVATGALLFFSKGFILTFYQISEASKALAVQFMNVLSVTVVGTSYQVSVLTGIVRGGGDTKFVLYNDSIFIWLVVIPLSAAAAFWLKLPPLIVFCCLKCDQILKCFVAVVKVNFCKWVKSVDQGQMELSEG